jgi:hypothetical protein
MMQELGHPHLCPLPLIEERSEGSQRECALILTFSQREKEPLRQGEEVSSEEALEIYGFSTSGLCTLTGLPSMKFSIFVIASS